MSLENSPKFLLNFSEVGMNCSGEKHFYQFKSFRLNVEERQLLQNESVVSLTPKAFDLLALLVEQNGHLVEKDELLRTVWADSFVEEANIPRLIHTLRKTLGEDEKENKFIETVAKKGYRFVAEVTETTFADTQSQGSGDAATDRQRNAATVEEKSPRPRDSASARSELKSNTRAVLFAVGFLTAVFLLVLLSFNLRSDSATKPGEIKSIAVLPVKPIGAGVRDEIYEVGIADALINRIGAMKGFYVRPLSATRKYTDIEQDPIAAGREQQTDYVLAANYQIADGRVRLTAQLYNVESGQIEDTYKIEKEASGIFAVQDAVTGEIVKSLQARLGMIPDVSAAQRGTTNEVAYRLFLQGKNLADRRNPADFRKAIDYFEQALRLDPNYALALAWMANAYHGLGVQRAESPRDVIEKSKQAVKRALELDPNLAEAYTVRARINYSFEWDFAAAERDFQRALELEPNNEMTHCWYAVWASYNGRFDQAMTEIETALAINPGSVYYQRERGRILYFARRYDEAVAQLKRVSELEESFIHLWLTNAYQMQGDHAGAYEAFIKFQKRNNPDRLAAYQKTYETSGWDGVRRRYIEFSRLDAAKFDVSLTSLAKQSALLGEKEEAFEFLDKAVERREWMIVTMKVEPAFDSLRGDPRFDKLVSRIGLK